MLPGWILPPAKTISIYFLLLHQVYWWDAWSRLAAEPHRDAFGRNRETWPWWLGHHSTVLKPMASFWRTNQQWSVYLEWTVQLSVCVSDSLRVPGEKRAAGRISDNQTSTRAAYTCSGWGEVRMCGAGQTWRGLLNSQESKIARFDQWRATVFLVSIYVFILCFNFLLCILHLQEISPSIAFTVHYFG